MVFITLQVKYVQFAWGLSFPMELDRASFLGDFDALNEVDGLVHPWIPSHRHLLVDLVTRCVGPGRTLICNSCLDSSWIRPDFVSLQLVHPWYGKLRLHGQWESLIGGLWHPVDLVVLLSVAAGSSTRALCVLESLTSVVDTLEQFAWILLACWFSGPVSLVSTEFDVYMVWWGPFDFVDLIGRLNIGFDIGVRQFLVITDQFGTSLWEEVVHVLIGLLHLGKTMMHVEVMVLSGSYLLVLLVDIECTAYLLLNNQIFRVTRLDHILWLDVSELGVLRVLDEWVAIDIKIPTQGCLPLFSPLEVVVPVHLHFLWLFREVVRRAIPASLAILELPIVLNLLVLNGRHLF